MGVPLTLPLRGLAFLLSAPKSCPPLPRTLPARWQDRPCQQDRTVHRSPQSGPSEANRLPEESSSLAIKSITSDVAGYGMV